MKSKIVGLLAVGMISGPVSAYATVIDFESLAHSGEVISVASPYIEEGYSFTNEFNLGFYVRGTTSPFYLGSAALTPAIINGTVSISAVGASPFDLISLDMGRSPYENIDGSTTFVGTLSGGGTVSKTVQRNYGFTTVSFDGFTGLSSVSWWNTFGTNFQLDNVVVRASGSVPEPGALALLGLGLAGLAASRRRKAV